VDLKRWRDEPIPQCTRRSGIACLDTRRQELEKLMNQEDRPTNLYPFPGHLKELYLQLGGIVFPTEEHLPDNATVQWNSRISK
jgi:hypothetical protein